MDNTWMVEKKKRRLMVGRKDYKYENKIDGWLDGWIQTQMNSWMDRKNRWMVGCTGNIEGWLAG